MDVLSTPGSVRFSAAGLVARMPMSMIGIGTVLMVQTLTGSYATAGRVAAVLVVAASVVAPQVARLVDRAGQRRVMLPLLVTTTAGLLGLVAAAVLGAPEWVLWLLAAVGGGAQGSYGSMVRARWSYLLTGPKRLHTAYSFESALDEVVYIVGPVLATVLATGVTPSAGLLAATVVGGLGAAWFLAQRATEPPVGRAHPDVPVDPAASRSALRMPGIPVLVVVFVAMGALFGSSDVATVAFAEEVGAKSAAGFVLASFALGSMVSGLGYGARHWLSPLSRRFVIGACALSALVSLFLLVGNLVALAAVMFAAGFAVAPTLINGNALIQALVAPQQLTEGLTWMGTALGVGVSIGSWLAGARIDAVDAHAGFFVTVVAGWACAALSVAALPSLRRRAPYAAQRAPAQTDAA